MPSYETNAQHGYMGDPRRGAALGRPSITPDRRKVAELDADATDNDAWALEAERDRENRRTPDSFKAQYWDIAAESFRREAKRIREVLRPRAVAREAVTPKITLRQIRLDSGGYDSTGAYWGHHQRLYWAASDDGEYDTTMRAVDRADAKAQVREVYPNARFYN